MACIDSDVVGNTFQQGQVAFDLHLLPAELQAKPTKLRTAALQPATLALSAPSCPKPTLPNLMLGSVQDSSLYSLHPCDCFGAAHAHVAPVDAASNAAVPRNAQGHFNNGSVPGSVVGSFSFVLPGPRRKKQKTERGGSKRMVPAQSVQDLHKELGLFCGVVPRMTGFYGATLSWERMRIYFRSGWWTQRLRSPIDVYSRGPTPARRRWLDLAGGLKRKA